MFHKIYTAGSVLLLAILFSSTTLAANKLYKWADEAGNIHYTEKPPTEEGRAVTQPATEATPLDTTPVVIPQPADLQASQQLADRCQGLYRELETYLGRQPIADSEGNVMVVSEEMREAKITGLKAELDQSCR